MGDEELDGWLSPLEQGHLSGARPLSRLRLRAPGCPEFGEASVVDRPFFSSDEPSVHPGLHAPRQGPHAVVWWDPHALNLGAPASFGLRQEEILLPLDASESESPSLKTYREWQAKRDQVSAAAQAKHFDIFTATEAAEQPAGFETVITHELIVKSGDRPSGPRFGTLVHTILRDAPLDADLGALAALAEVHGRLLGATPEEVEHSGTAALAALRHPLIERARRAKNVRREFPIMLKLDGARVLEGVIDLAFEAEDRWHIVDFKTDADVAANRARYERQLQWYAARRVTLEQRPGAKLTC